MKSAAFHHFPQVVANPDRYLLFNPILKKRYENRPEERVRLKWVEYILHQTDWKKSRIGFETPVNVSQEKNTLRADLILYSEKMKPSVLVECKSDSIKINQSAAEQAARYNTDLKAQHLVLTNGIEDYWFEKTENNVRPAKSIFDEELSFSKKEKGLDYWQQRGFCSSTSDLKTRDWLKSALTTFWSEGSDGTKKYLDFQKTVLPVPMNQYYKIFEMNAEQRLAISFIGYGTSDNYIIAVLNISGSNQGILVINLNKLQKEKKGSISIIKGKKRETDFSAGELPIDFTNFQASQIEILPESIMKFFD